MASFDNSGKILNLVSTSGLVVFLEPQTDSAPLWHATMRVIWSDGRIVPVRTAIEDQFRFDTRTCPFSADGIILVPFQLVFDADFAVVRVQPPSSTGLSSCLVRLKYRNEDHSRFALTSADWLYIYEMGIIDMKIRAGIVLILTHTCAVELFLGDDDPTPVVMSLPRDRIDVIFSDTYIAFCQAYRRYCFPVNPDLKKERPQLRNPLREAMQVVVDTDEQAETPLIATVMDFGDTRPSYACPWIELAVTNSMLYLNTVNGVYVCMSEWTPLISAKTGRSVYAVTLYASEKDLFVQEGESAVWRKFDSSGNETVLDFDCPLLFASGAKLMTSEFILDNAPAHPADPLSCGTKRCYASRH